VLLPRTPLCELLGIDLPIVPAPNGIGTPSESRRCPGSHMRKPGERRSPKRTALWACGITIAIATPALLITHSSALSEPTAAGAEPVASCTIDSLATLGGLFGNVTAANQQGMAVGTATDKTGASHAVLWRSGKPEQLVTGTTSGIAVGINARGDVIGTGQADGVAVGWAWTGGATTRLKTGANRVAVPSAINDRGVIVGGLSENEGTEGATRDENEHEQAVLWDSAGSEPRTLIPLPGDNGAHAFAVDNHNRVGGVSQGNRFAPVIWDAAGKPRALPTLGGDYGVVRALSDSGLAAGDAVAADGKDHPVVWDAAGRITDLGLPAGARSGQARAILPGGVIVGTVDVPAAGGGFRTRAVQWTTPGAARLLPAAHGGAAMANGGADGTTYVGNSTDTLGGQHPSIWHCRR
jgi:uncharacterized membrane protein